MSNSLFSQEAQAKLKALKTKLGDKSGTADAKPPAPKKLPSQKKIKKMQAQLGQDAPEEDALLFRQAVTGVRPLADKNTIKPSALKTQKPKQDGQLLARRAAAMSSDEESAQPAISDMQALMNPVSSEAYLMYKDTTLQNRIFTQLKQGKLRWFEAVDIHGSTIEEAREAVLKVIDITKENGYTVCKVVHGKGKDAVLKTCVNGWLRQHPDVLAFVSATPKDGGAGAVLVLLRRSKDD